MNQLKIKLLPGSKMPTKGTTRAAAWDCYARENVTIGAKPKAVSLGFALEIPDGYHIKIIPRSSIGLNTNLRMANSIGIIDSDYRGEVKAIYESKIAVREAHSYGNSIGYYVEPSWVHIEAGTRIAQMILERNEDFELVEVDKLSDTERGTGGFGSTGK